MTENISNLNYRITFDHTGEMNKLWMQPSFAPGIPIAFVVDRDSHIAFPTKLDDVLPKVLKGIWRASVKLKPWTRSDRRKPARSARTSDHQAHLRQLRPAMEGGLESGALGGRRMNTRSS
ncbi:hypothetical protein [Bradyrhizobium valentinum]|uniref:hypothetical protein n=1 Tax=Bradyrhizobium valentinum TaxID=1518501 RepID=UPI0012E34A19|nr:hypothetical protein [Bradyrhizobium valentinum]